MHNFVKAVVHDTKVTQIFTTSVCSEIKKQKLLRVSLILAYFCLAKIMGETMGPL